MLLTHDLDYGAMIAATVAKCAEYFDGPQFVG
jgi:hypothetical protein